MLKIKSVIALAGLFTVIASGSASACGGFPFSQGPGLGSSTRFNLSLDAGDVVTVTYSSPGSVSFGVSKSAPGAVEDIVPLTTGPVSGVATYVAATTSANYNFTASRAGPFDDQHASVSYTCAAAPAPAPVPTLSEWAMILFGLLMAGGAALYIQRRRMFA